MNLKTTTIYLPQSEMILFQKFKIKNGITAYQAIDLLESCYRDNPRKFESNSPRSSERRISPVLDVMLLQSLKISALEHGISVSAFVAALISSYINKKTFKAG